MEEKIKENQVHIVVFDQNGLPTVRVFTDLDKCSDYVKFISLKTNIFTKGMFTETLDRGSNEIKYTDNNFIKVWKDSHPEPTEENQLHVVLFSLDGKPLVRVFTDLSKGAEYQNYISLNRHITVYMFTETIDIGLEEMKSMTPLMFPEVWGNAYLDSDQNYKQMKELDIDQECNKMNLKDDIKARGFIQTKNESDISEEKEESSFITMKVPEFLGIGSAFNTDLGNTSCYFIELDTLILIDCGSDVFPKVKKILNKYDYIKHVNILITHMHSDHTGSLPTLIEYCYHTKKIIPEIIYPEQSKMRDMLNDHLIGEELYSTDFHSSPIRGEKGYCVTSTNSAVKFKINTIKLVHNIYNDWYSYGYIINRSDKTFIFVWDTCDVHPEIHSIFRSECNRLGSENVYLFHDVYFEDFAGCPHTNFNKIKSVITKNKDRVFFVHLDNKEELDKIAKESGFGDINLFYKK